MGASTHQGLSPSEQAFLDLCDRFYEELERRGERAAGVLVKRARIALDEGVTTMSSNISKAIALLQAERNDVELAGDMTTGEHLTMAIYWALCANGQADPPDDADALPAQGAAIDDTEPGDALQMSKRMRKGEAGFLKVYDQVNGPEIRKRPGHLAANFASGSPRANPAAPMAPPADTEKLAKAAAELDEARFKRQVVEIYGKGPTKII